MWCRFPEHESLGEPGPKARPAVVLNVAHDPESDESEVQLIYGTTKLKMMKRREDFFISNLSDMDACGLTQATRFDLDTIMWIPWAAEWFDVLPGYDTPVIGNLTPHKTRLLQIDLAYKAASLKPVDNED